ncbi:glycoside hydrolase family 127 protein [Paenibacillus sp. EKM202P]|uniref:glycoside hydrolase family 127 protein n=1 Tax=unclassified Paenibacillus TaxID=185978 RepID=UPI0013EC8E82|nr:MULTISPECIES: beta-L-arabinofuranosidase domain-containing protein [unclassified Paenibacillus]KAF6562181.1 glycoside hydrolase family 127 protein [Paenibacillus sp. EKM202P]KAF6566417.1 glycoside hydrolase family 127 protein [Paenibacillus sp. EKM207P]
MKTAKPVKHVIVDDSFWKKYKQVVAEEVIPYQWKALNDELPDTEPSHAIENFRIAAGESSGEYYGTVFQDSDLAKWLETVAFSLRDHPNSALEERADEVIDLLGRAQAEDGYLNTYYLLKEPDNRWTNLRDNHELYCAGHFIEAAVAYYETTGKTKFLNIMEKYVDLIQQIFGTEEGKRKGYPGHEEIELALIKLYDVTAKDQYLKLAQYFIEQRGQHPIYFVEEQEKRKHIQTEPTWNDDNNINFGLGFEYQQAHQPVREQKEAVGHAVRAVYLYIAMADLAAKTGDASLLQTCETLWDDVTNHKMYITAGIGSTVNAEAFTCHHDLPNDSMYCETCASVGLAFWANRMLRLAPDRKYADVLERALYNGTISGMDLDGKRFFYVNPLEVNPFQKSRKDQEHVKTERQKWFFCACCPPNLARMIASVEDNMYTQTEDTLYTHLYIASKVNMTLSGQEIEITQTHHYPWDADLALSIHVTEPTAFKWALRIPGWCKQAEVKVNGEVISLDHLEKGYVEIQRTWKDGDMVTLHLAMPVERIRSNPLVSMNQQQVALQRGPVVYCLEEADNGANLAGLRLPKDNPVTEEFSEHLLGGIVKLTIEGYRVKGSNALYSSEPPELVPQQITAIPYYAWCNRAKGEMRIWVYES